MESLTREKIEQLLDLVATLATTNAELMQLLHRVMSCEEHGPLPAKTVAMLKRGARQILEMLGDTLGKPRDVRSVVWGEVRRTGERTITFMLNNEPVAMYRFRDGVLKGGDQPRPSDVTKEQAQAWLYKGVLPDIVVKAKAKLERGLAGPETYRGLFEDPRLKDPDDHS